MKYTITNAPTFSKLDVSLDAGQSIIAQPNSMLSMTTGVDVTAKMGGQLWSENQKSSRLHRALKSLLSGEDIFTAIFTAKRDGERISLAPEFIGEIVPLKLQHSSYYITRGAFLASEMDVRMAVKYGGVKGYLSKTGLFLMHASGQGNLFLSSYGAVVRHHLAEGEQLVVDNSYMIAFADSVTYDLVKAARKISHAFMSGEGLVNRFTGPGEIIYQTRSRPKQGGFLRSIVELAT